MIHLENVDYTNPVGISVELAFVTHDDSPETRILVAKVSGDYPSGSLGTPHARFIAAETMKAVIFYDPDAIILDVSRLDYAWGDGLLGTIQDVTEYLNRDGEKDEPAYPFAMITSKENRAPIMSLLGGPDYDPDWEFSNLADAVGYLSQAYQEWLDY